MNISREDAIERLVARMQDDGETTVGDVNLILRFSRLLNISPELRRHAKAAVFQMEQATRDN